MKDKAEEIADFIENVFSDKEFDRSYLVSYIIQMIENTTKD